MADDIARTQLIGAEKLVALLESGTANVLLIDSRPFVEYNTSHILEAININCSKLMKRRLQQDKLLITELIQHSAKQKVEIDFNQEVVVYDQSSKDVSSVSPDSFLTVLLGKLEKSFRYVHLLSGGFVAFSNCFPGLCEGKSAIVPTCISQPCLPVANLGPTRILPHLYLGCQRDVLNKELMQQNDIAYVLNASNTCPKPDFIPESHFLRVPVNDSFCEKILPWLDKSVEFIEKAKASNSRVLVHCLAGISRSATIAIAYIMKRMNMSLDEAYRFVKEKRPTISPNFNFLGQLLDFEKGIKSETGQSGQVTKLKLLHLDKAVEHESVQDDDHCNFITCLPCTTISTSETVDQSIAAEPATVSNALLDTPAFNNEEECLLVQDLSGLHVSSEKLEDNNRLKRSFSLDIKSMTSSSNVTGTLHFASAEETLDYFRASGADSTKVCQFSPVEEVSEQTPETSPDREEAVVSESKTSSWQSHSQSKPEKMGRSTTTLRSFMHPLHRSGSMEDTCRNSFLFGLSTSQQHLARSAVGVGLKGWHSDILMPQTSGASLANSWYFATDSSHFYSTSAIFGGSTYSAYSCGQLSTGCDQASAVRRRQKHNDRGDSRRSWHEESSFEKQFKRRSCQMEFEESLSDSRSREDLGKIGSQSSFSGSMEIIEVS
ncbi:dual specificity protein phosphatase 16 [Protopterus annectens]|uniref:dual specificity protein phosphatase 16 n=1 Tax=Protopterus annectens TaxID=7888 RepID=UPI001CF97472|nr:dual specificity protein phosphatase 16 [Protopterus annectens]XP_043944068.1 dual specificity protein phosphatase 16 [Protopterus annectens]XP_043944069.1 dual specificity protein phosphatase 16 [Protopterus annectens]XP_043944070.1 dual specificity protein phosphatase 16 [Protopterus annectens]XP_043944071.1 dual specificity protein phosphatase 16 [Protopterus annectens]